MEFGILFSRFRLAIFVSDSSIIESGQLAKVASVRHSDLLAALPVALTSTSIWSIISRAAGWDAF